MCVHVRVHVCVQPSKHDDLGVLSSVPVEEVALHEDLLSYLLIFSSINRHCGPGSSAGIATELRAGRPGIESRWGRDFPPVQTGLVAHPASCKMGTGSFPGVKCGRGVLLTTHPPSSAAVMEE